MVGRCPKEAHHKKYQRLNTFHEGLDGGSGIHYSFKI